MANNISVKDAAASSQVVKTTDNAGVHTPHHNVDTFPTTWDGTKTDAASALPAGGAGLIGWLSRIWTTLSGTLAISAASLPLPTGASTSAKQDTAITHLAAIETAVEGTLAISGNVGLVAAQSVNIGTLPAISLAASGNTIGAVGVNAGENHIGEVSSGMWVASNFLVRPFNTTSYATGQLVGANTAVNAANVMAIANASRAGSQKFAIRRLRMRKSSNNLVNAQFRIHVWKNAAPTLTVGDGGAFNVNGVLASDGVLNYLGAFDVTFQQGFSDGAMAFGIPIVGNEIIVDLSAGTSIYACIEARAAYVPTGSEAITLMFETFRD